MRGFSSDIIRAVTTLLLGVFVVYGLYTFGTEIFKAGARISISTSESGEECACASNDVSYKIKCSGKIVDCRPCEVGETGLCKNTQNIVLRDISPVNLKKLKVCASEFTQAGRSIKPINIFTNGNLLGSMSGNCEVNTAPCCKEFSFSSLREVKVVAADAGTGSSLQILEAYWQAG